MEEGDEGLDELPESLNPLYIVETLQMQLQPLLL